MTQSSFQVRSLSLEENPGWLKALTLNERLASFIIPNSFEATEKAHRRLQKWKEQGPFNKENYFSRRLESDNLSEADFLFLLGETPQELKARFPEIPAWLNEIAEAYAEKPASKINTGAEAELPAFAGMPLAL